MGVLYSYWQTVQFEKQKKKGKNFLNHSHNLKTNKSQKCSRFINQTWHFIGKFFTAGVSILIHMLNSNFLFTSLYFHAAGSQRKDDGTKHPNVSIHKMMEPCKQPQGYTYSFEYNLKCKVLLTLRKSPRHTLMMQLNAIIKSNKVLSLKRFKQRKDCYLIY